MTIARWLRLHAAPRAGWAAAASVLLIAGCGGTPGQVPASAEPVVDGALTTLAASCGEALEIRALGRDHGHLGRLDAAAAPAARRLAALASSHGAWSYKSEPLSAVAATWRANLGACGLPGAASILGAGG